MSSHQCTEPQETDRPRLASGALKRWRSLPAAQQPDWPNPVAARDIIAELTDCPPLVAARECDLLKLKLASVAQGEAFLLQGGDCAERFDGVTVDAVHNTVQTLLQMSAILTYSASIPVIKVGRIAGQYAKPRSKATETRDGVTLPTYRGDAVNGHEFTAAARIPDPHRLRRTYELSAVTLDLIRTFATNNSTTLNDVHAWNHAFIARSPTGRHYDRLTSDIDRALRFMRAYGVDPTTIHTAELFTSHEGLILDYETALTRIDTPTGRPYATSGHMLWIGERTRDLDGAHVDYFSHIANPIGVKLGPNATPDTALTLIDKLDPHREPGRLTYIIRMGAGRIWDRLPDLVHKVTTSGAQVVWVCDPMHGNTFESPSGHKTRRFIDILREVESFFAIHRALGTHPGGIHVELTGENVTECVGGGADITFEDLHQRYETTCDPRLNHNQSLDLAFLIAKMMMTPERPRPPTTPQNRHRSNGTLTQPTRA
jgi:3-deoxy-7-phosphoheptulonate synthase